MSELGQILGTDPPDENHEARLAVCAKCPLHTDFLGKIWCGIPILDAVLSSNKDEPCGCNMNRKTKVTTASCHIRSWDK